MLDNIGGFDTIWTGITSRYEVSRTMDRQLKLITLILCFLFWQACAPHPSPVPALSEATNRECERLYSAWHRECETIRFSSNTHDYIGLPSYRKIVALGKPALPFLERRMAEDRGLDFMLAYAVVEICGWDRQEFGGGSGQDFRYKVLKKLRENRDRS